MKSVNGLPGLSADTADLIFVDFRSVRSRLLIFFCERDVCRASFLRERHREIDRRADREADC